MVQARGRSSSPRAWLKGGTAMHRLLLCCIVTLAAALPVQGGEAPQVLRAGFGEGRKATRIHDPLMARAVVLEAGKIKVALVSVDVVGLFREPVERVRQQLPGFAYVLVSSTHNHEGPDTLGLWGATFASSG